MEQKIKSTATKCVALSTKVFSVPRIGVSNSSHILNPCSDAANKVNRTFGFINRRNLSFKSKDVILPLYNSLVSLQPQSVQCKVTKMVSSLCDKPYDEKLSALNMFPLEKRRLRGKLIECFKIQNSLQNVEISTPAEIGDMMQTHVNSTKLNCRKVNSNCTIFFFTSVVTREWDKLPPSVVQGSMIDIFENKLERYLLQHNIH